MGGWGRGRAESLGDALEGEWPRFPELRIEKRKLGYVRWARYRYLSLSLSFSRHIWKNRYFISAIFVGDIYRIFIVIWLLGLKRKAHVCSRGNLINAGHARSKTIDDAFDLRSG